MLPLYEKIEALCRDRGINVTQMCRGAGVARAVLSDYKTGRKQSISVKNLEKIADFFDISLDELTGRTQKEAAPIPLTRRDERDIEKRLAAALGDLEHASRADGLMFDGEPLDDETKELLAASLRSTLEMTKRLAKQKYTPKKYRKEGE